MQFKRADRIANGHAKIIVIWEYSCVGVFDVGDFVNNILGSRFALERLVGNIRAVITFCNICGWSRGSACILSGERCGLGK